MALLTKELDASRMLDRVWRVEYDKTGNVSCPFKFHLTNVFPEEIVPRKPLYFMKSDIEVAAGCVIRLV